MAFSYRITGDFDYMAPGLGFRPGVLESLGLGHLHDIDLVNAWQLTPESTSQFLIGPRHRQPSNWLKVSDKLEIGWNDLPLPKALERPAIVPGVPIADANGNDWLIPNGNPQSVRCSIPQDYQWTMSGPHLVPDVQYAWLVQLCDRTFQHLIESDVVDHQWTGQQALKIMQVNYRLGLPELMAYESAGVQTLTKNIATMIVCWFVDSELLQDYVKKKQADES